jgi:hypothetical protein
MSVAGTFHGNDLRTTKPATGYSLQDRNTGEVLKFGETTRGKARYSKGYLQQHNAEFVEEANGTKREMHRWQTDQIRQYKQANGGNRPRLNKTDY